MAVAAGLLARRAGADGRRRGGDEVGIATLTVPSPSLGSLQARAGPSARRGGRRRLRGASPTAIRARSRRRRAPPRPRSTAILSLSGRAARRESRAGAVQAGSATARSIRAGRRPTNPSGCPRRHVLQATGPPHVTPNAPWKLPPSTGSGWPSTSATEAPADSPKIAAGPRSRRARRLVRRHRIGGLTGRERDEACEQRAAGRNAAMSPRRTEGRRS